MTSPCGCRVGWTKFGEDGKTGNARRFIRFCPLHAAAEEMLAELKDEMTRCDIHNDECPNPKVHDKFKAIIARAEGKG